MSEATGGSGRTEVERRLIEKSLQDESFRRRLLADPKAVVEQELGGVRLPGQVRIQVLEETPDTLYLVLPPTNKPDHGSGELSDQELEAVAGGYNDTSIMDPPRFDSNRG